MGIQLSGFKAYVELLYEASGGQERFGLKMFDELIYRALDEVERFNFRTWKLVKLLDLNASHLIRGGWWARKI